MTVVGGIHGTFNGARACRALASAGAKPGWALLGAIVETGRPRHASS